MAEPNYNDWMTRAREHRAAGRALDALICYRRAARALATAGDPHFGIGEVFWQLGRAPEALAAWRHATTRTPRHLPAWQAQADAALATGDFAGARRAALQALGLTARDDRMGLVAAITASPPEGTVIGARLAAAPRLLAEAHVSRALATVMRALPAGTSRSALTAALLPNVDVLEASLVAQLGAAVPDATIAALLQRPVARDDIEPARSLAVALHEQGATRQALADAAASRYAAACMAWHTPDVPLLWPLRTGAPRLRVLLLVSGDAPQLLAAALQALAGQVQPVDMAVLAAVAAPEHAGAEARAATAATAIRAQLDASPFADSLLAHLPPFPDSESARTIALRDADVLVDLAGIAAATGPLIAAGAARSVWRVERPAPLPPALAARTLADAGPALAQALAALRTSIEREPPRQATATLAAVRDAAVKANGANALADARAGYDALLAEQPGHAPTLYLRSLIARDAGDDAAAMADLDAALAAAPRDARSRVAAAQLDLRRHDVVRARERVEAGLALAPDDVALLRMRGHVAIEARDGVAALNAFARAVAVDPLNAETHFNYGVALQMLHYPAEAARAYQHALTLAPGMVEAYFNLGVLHNATGDVDGAVRALEWVVTHEPARADAHRTLVNVLHEAHRHEAWKAAVLRFERDCPAALGLVDCALEYHQLMGDHRAVQRYLKRLELEEFKPAHELDLTDSLEQLLYMLLFFDVEPDVMASLYRTYDRAARRVYGAPLPPRERRAPGPLRIGYLSADLRNHVMGNMMFPPLALHDRERFVIHLYASAPASAEDAVTAQFAAVADSFVRVHELTDAEAADRIAADDLDVLVDLSTHTLGAREGIVARKPARVVVTHVASAGALGLSAVDFKLTDRFADRPEVSGDLVETLLPMAGCVYPVRRTPPPATHGYRRDTLGIAVDDVVIGAFVTPLKLSRRTLALWKEVLDRVPRARLAFSPNAPWLREAYPRLLEAAGIDPARALFVPPGHTYDERLGRYALVDFVLDPMPFGNVNGTIEPLNCGVPVVTLCGQQHGERTGYSLLSNLGVTATIAHSGRDYVAIAVRLATDAAFMHDVRASIVAAMAASPLTDMPAYTRNLEDAYMRALALAGADAVTVWNSLDGDAVR